MNSRTSGGGSDVGIREKDIVCQRECNFIFSVVRGEMERLS